MKYAKGTFNSKYLGSKGPLEVHQGQFRVTGSSEPGAYGMNKIWKRVKR